MTAPGAVPDAQLQLEDDIKDALNDAARAILDESKERRRESMAAARIKEDIMKRIDSLRESLVVVMPRHTLIVFN